MVDRDTVYIILKCLQTNAKDDHHMTVDNRKSCSINRDKTDNIITFKAKGFVKTFLKNKCSPVIS